ncbi:MAG: hypothetical protein PHI18_07035 [bacterium]|nr:hypothetical protein [bacterium]
MNAAQIHLALNHAPLMGLGFGLLVLLYGLVRKSADVQRAALIIFLLTAILVIPVVLSGEEAEDVVKGLPNVADSRIEPHEEAAVTAQVMMILLGIASLGGLYLLHTQKSLKLVASISLLVLSAIALLVMLYVSSLGGKISHPELRAGYARVSGSETGDDDD